jgi:hypothetical protein
LREEQFARGLFESAFFQQGRARRSVRAGVG